jgi:hypothetical protein
VSGVRVKNLGIANLGIRKMIIEEFKIDLVPSVNS